MKILFLTPQLPYPLVSGGVFKSFKMIEFMGQYYEVKLGSLLKNKDQEFIEEFLLKVKLKETYFEYLSIPRNIKTFLTSIIQGIPLSIYRNYSKSFKQKIEDMAKDVDIIFVDHFLMFQYIPESFKGKIIFHSHNAEYVMWSRYAQENSFLKKVALYFESWRIKNYEIKIIKRSNAVFATPNDIVEFKKIAPNGNFKTTYHLGDDTLLNEPFIAFSQRENTLLYIGTLTWEANRDGLYWFLENVWQDLKKEISNLKLIVIGKNMPDDFSYWKNDSAINWKGFVQDLTPFYNGAKVFISPLRFGSGIKVKNVNALYRGIPLVTTAVGAEGLALQDEIHAMVADQKSQFKEKIQKLVSDEEKWSKISLESRKYARENLSWDAVLKEIDKVLNGC